MAKRDQLPEGTLQDGLPRPTEPGPAPTLPAVEVESQPLPTIIDSGELETIPRANYEHLSEIARGGLGRIYRAVDQRLDRLVAIKELLRPTPTANARFLREIALTVRLEHPNIVSIYEAGRWPSGELFYAMNFVAGRTLLQTLEDATSLSERLALLPHLINVAEAVAFAHSEGIIHRDLKPANVLVGRFGETVVIDWGLAKYRDTEALPSKPRTAMAAARQRDVPFSQPPPPIRAQSNQASSEREKKKAQSSGRAEPATEATAAGVPRAAGGTKVGAIVGTPPYMPPEQAQGRAVDERSDVYAMGAMLYHVLGGKPPYHDEPQDRLLESIQEHAPSPLSELEHDLAPDLLAIVDKAMARDPDARYKDGGAMAEELKRFRDGRLVGAYEYTLRDLARRFVRRYSAAVLTASVAALVLVMAAGFGFSRIRQERDSAERHAVEAEQERDRAKERYEALIVARADALTETDPTSAIAWLKQLKRPVTNAISVAARAEEAGVSRWVLRGPEAALYCSALSPDGKWFVTGGDDSRVYIWRIDEKTPELVTTEQKNGHSDRVTACMFSPDGRYLATSSRDGSLLLWKSGRFDFQRLEVPGGAIKSLSFNSDGSRLLAATDTPNPLDTLREWRVENGKFIDRKVPNARTPFVAFSSKNRILSGPHDGKARVWEAWSGSDTVPEVMHDSPETAEVSTAVWLDSDRVLLGLDNGQIQIWNPARQSLRLIDELPSPITNLTLPASSGVAKWVSVACSDGYVYRVELEAHEPLHLPRNRLEPITVDRTPTEAHSRLMRHLERVNVVSASPGGRFVASGGWDKPIRVVNLQMGTQRVLLGHKDVISGLHFTPDERYLVSTSWDKTVRFWALDTALQQHRRVLRGHTVGVHGARFSPHAARVGSGGHDDTVRLWDLKSRTHQVMAGHTDHVYRVIFSPDGKYLASSSDDRSVMLWNTTNNEVQPLEGHQADVEELAFSPDSRLLASASEDHTARVWDLQKTPPEAQVIKHNHDVTQVRFSADGTWFATASRDHLVRVFRVLATGRVEHYHTFENHHGEVWGLDFNPQGQLASSDELGAIWLHDLQHKQSDELASVSSTQHLCFSPDGAQVAVAAQAGQIWLCPLDGKECKQVKNTPSAVHTIKFSPDGHTLYSAGSNAQLVAWDLASLERRVYLGHRSPIFDIDVSRDGSQLLTASADETVRVWPAVELLSDVGFKEGLELLTGEEIRASEEVSRRPADQTTSGDKRAEMQD